MGSSDVSGPGWLATLQGVRSAPRVVLAVATLAIFTDTLVYALIIPVIPGYLGEGATPSDMGLLVSVYAGALLLATPIFGLVVDRVGHRAPMILGLLGLALTTVLFGLARSLPLLVAARALQGTACAATATASLALLASTFGPEQRGKAMGIWTAGNAAGTLLGPPMGGWLFQVGGHWGPLALAGGLAVIDGLARMVLIAPSQVEAKRTPLRRFLAHPAVLDICAVALFGAAGLTLLEATLPLYLTRQFTASPLLTGAFFTVATIAFAVTAPIAGALEGKWGRLKVAVLGLMLLSLVLPLLPFMPTLTLALVAVGLVGAAVGLTITPALPALAETVDQMGGASYGFAYSLFNCAFAGGAVAGPLVGSLLTEVFGLRIAFTVLSGVMLVAAGVLRMRVGSRTASLLISGQGLPKSR